MKFGLDEYEVVYNMLIVVIIESYLSNFIHCETYLQLHLDWFEWIM